MKYFPINITISILLFQFVLSCTNTSVSESLIKIDLDQSKDTIFYSEFANKLDYIQLNSNDSCILTDIEKIYMDDDTILILDTKKAGVLVFTFEGKFVRQINYYGEGPREFMHINIATIDPILNNVCIFDYATQKIIKYSYSGDFVKSFKYDQFVRDFAVLKDEINLCMYPFDMKSSLSGNWTSDTNNVVLKKLDTTAFKDDQFEFSGTYYNRNDQGVFYYGGYWDYLSYITKDTSVVLYNFDLKQQLDEDLRRKDPKTLYPFKDFAYMTNFSVSPKYVLLTYNYLGKENPYKWVLLDRDNKNTKISDNIYNDIDFVQTDYRHIYYLNDSTWCRIIETDDNTCNTHLQIIKLKKHFNGETEK